MNDFTGIGGLLGSSLTSSLFEREAINRSFQNHLSANVVSSSAPAFQAALAQAPLPAKISAAPVSANFFADPSKSLVHRLYDYAKGTGRTHIDRSKLDPYLNSIVDVQIGLRDEAYHFTVLESLTKTAKEFTTKLTQA